MEDPGPYLLSITSVPKSGEPDHCMGLIFESGQQPQVLTSIHHGDGVVVGVTVLKKNYIDCLTTGLVYRVHTNFSTTFMSKK